MRRLLRLTTSEGQAAVETAIVAPLFIFTILGMMQFALIYQARAMLKYAAYRAARAGAMQNGCKSPMRDVAYSVLLPVIANPTGDAYLKATSIADYAMGLAKIKGASMFGLNLVEVRICAPLKDWVSNSNQTFMPANDSAEVDFDDPQNVQAIDLGGGGEAGTLRGFERTKLRIQLKYYHKMIIPFANWMIFRTWTGQKLVENMRMGKNRTPPTLKWDKGRRDGGGTGGEVVRPEAESQAKLILLSKTQRYYLPLYANYTFRMQSNLYIKDCPLPKDNECWHYAEGGKAVGAGP